MVVVVEELVLLVKVTLQVFMLEELVQHLLLLVHL
jgi:hypothetical protein